MLEFLTGGSPGIRNHNPLRTRDSTANTYLRDLTTKDGIHAVVEFSTDLKRWDPGDANIAPATDQSGAPAGFTLWRVTWPAGQRAGFLRLRAY